MMVNQSPDALNAHTPNTEGQWHSLLEHSQAVAGLAKKFADAFMAGPWGDLLGRLHDLGKANPLFQEYLNRCVQQPSGHFHGPVHSVYGAAYAKQKHLPDLLLFALAGHHAGLPNRADLKQLLQQYGEMPPFLEYWPQWELQAPSIGDHLQSPLSALFFTRMIFSCLVDADFLDTEAHFVSQRAQFRRKQHNFSDLWKAFETDQRHLLKNSTGPINILRGEIYAHCLTAADKPKGVFTLTVPTGAGKTRSVMGFALCHAIKWDMPRIIVAIPYTSIVDQSAAIYKGILGENNVLEHHSQVQLDDREDRYGNLQWSRLASENWDAPIVVTTTVQLFDSLFANRPSACRKLHNLANSVVILDEVQTLPAELLQPILFALAELVRHYGATVAMSTATQPYFSRPEFSGIFENMVPIITNEGRYFAAMKRTEYHIHPQAMTIEEVAAHIRNRDQIMAVLNTKKDALRLFESVRGEDVFHLSTLLCPAHRREILGEVRRRLNDGEKVKLIATQVVEAGVDLDFPVVMRAIGPLDRIVQAAGRCNREGKLERGEVQVFDLKDGVMPQGAYKTGADHARAMLKAAPDLDAPQTHREYFERLFRDVNTDSKKIMECQREFKFAAVAERFHLIPDNSEAVLVPYPEQEAQCLIERLDRCAKGWENARETLRACQPHLVNIYRHQVARLLKEGLICPLPLGLYCWLGKYDHRTGLQSEALDPEKLVF